MKTLFRALVLGVLMTALAAVAVTPSYAQTDDTEAAKALYEKFLANRRGPELDKLRTAVAAGEEFLSKYDNAEQKEVADYIRKQLPRIKESVKNSETNNRYNDGVKNKNWDAAFTAGKEIIAREGGNPLALDVMLTLASIGFDNVALATPNDKFNADAVNFAKQSIQLIEKGVVSDNYGHFNYVYKTKEYSDGKSNALAWMNYTIGFINYYRQGQTDASKKKEALPYFYKAIQYNSAVKKNFVPYQAIGAWYLSEAVKLGDEIKVKTEDIKKELEAAGGVENDTIKAKIEETKRLSGLQKGYAERAIDAYARAHNVAKTSNAPAEVVKDLETNLTNLYKFRFDKEEGRDAYVTATLSKPMPDPSTPVAPVIEEAPTTTTTTVNTVTPSVEKMTTVAVTTPVATKAVTTEAKVVAVKKPVAKKKGNR